MTSRDPEGQLITQIRL